MRNLLASLLVAGLIAAPAPAGAMGRDEVRRLVVAEAHDLGIDPALALAVAHAESYFDPKAESHVGARGVMQIMPATCRGEYALAATINRHFALADRPCRQRHGHSRP